MTGFILGVDGVDGAGKSTLAAGLASLLSADHRVVVVSTFSNDRDVRVEALGGASVSEVLYEIALSEVLGSDEVERQLALTIAARRHFQVTSRLRDDYDIVITDRSSLSSLAYGSASSPEVEALVRWAVLPAANEDLLLWLDVDVSMAFSRRTMKEFRLTGGGDVITPKGIAYQERAAETFRVEEAARPEVVRVDASLSAASVLERASRVVRERLP